MFILTWVSGQGPLQPESVGPVESAAEPHWLWGSTWLTAPLDSASADLSFTIKNDDIHQEQ